MLSTGYQPLRNLISDEIKCEFFRAEAVSVLLYGCTEVLGEKVKQKLYKNTARWFEQILEATPLQMYRICLPSHKPFK